MDALSNAIAVVGIYFALMAVLAVSVEAVIGWFKIPIPWLQGKPSTDDVLNEVKGWLTRDEQNQAQARVTALNKALKAIGETRLLKEGASAAQIAEAIGSATTKHIQNDRKRRAVIRLMAIGLGIGFAWLFQIDTLELLEPLLSSVDFGGAHTVGITLSGLAASAGSSFWHDQSARLRKLKSASEAVSELG